MGVMVYERFCLVWTSLARRGKSGNGGGRWWYRRKKLLAVTRLLTDDVSRMRSFTGHLVSFVLYEVPS